MEKGSLVGNIAQDLGIDVSRLKSRKARIYTGESADYIELNREQGVLRIKDRIDREALCGETTPCALHFQIILENPMEFYSVTIEIMDVNDNAPKFVKREIKYEVSESSLIGARFVLEKAIDEDVGANGLHSYALKPTDNFSLKTVNRGDGSKNVEMVLQKQLDREKQEHIALILTAVDGGEPVLSGTMTILITVLDANDNAPVCSKPEYKATVEENALLGTVVTTVSATDVDKGNNGVVTYMIPNTRASSLFNIDSNTGTITLAGHIDYEKRKKYEIDVQVGDQGGLSDSCKVIIDVVDANDNKPSINFMSKMQSLPENVKAGTVVTMINVQDADSARNGKVHCRLNENIPFSMQSTTNSFFTIVTDIDLDRETASEYNISVRCSDSLKPTDHFSLKLPNHPDGNKKVEMVLQKPLDREKHEEISLMLTAVDGGDPQRSGTVQIYITVLDANDNAPVFTQSVYKATLTENSVKGTTVTRVSATDSDRGTNSDISYSVSTAMDSVSDTFYINENGEVILNGEIDFEKSKIYEIDIEARDSGGLSDSSTARIEITVLDANDNAPTFSQAVYTASLVENSPKGALVTIVSASDRDHGSNGLVAYSISSSTDHILDVFKIDENTGQIHLSGALDYETSKHYQIDIKAKDLGGLYDSCKVMLDVTDVNDNSPVIDLISTTPLISEDAALQTVVAVMSVRDADSEDNGEVTCALNDNIEFSIKTDSNGFYSLVTDSVLDRERAAEYNVTVTCSDRGAPSLSSRVTLRLQVSDVNDNAPIFERESYEALIVENNTPGVSIYTIKASDVDWKQNARVSYILEDSSINGVPIYRWRQSRILYHSNLPVIPYYPPRYSDTLGTGTLQHVYNYEVCRTTDSRKSDCKFGNAGSQNVLIMDPSSTGTMQRIQSLLISVLFLPISGVLGQVSYTIPEEMAKGSLVGNIAQDIGVEIKRLKSGNARIYTGDDAEYIQLDKERGVLLIKERIDREAICRQTTPCALRFQIILEKPMEFYTITVEVTDINDNPPTFEKSEVHFKISESAMSGAKFVLDRAVDLDVGPNGLQSYDLKPTDNFDLKLHSQVDGTKNVEMVLQKPLDREQNDIVSLILTAVDGGEPRMSGTIQIVITVLDANDNEPVFTHSTYKATVVENSPKGTVVTSVSATDADQGTYGKVTYSLSNILDHANGIFYVNKESGEISVIGTIDYETAQGELDRETASEFNISVTCSDQGVPALSSNVTLNLQISDVNDNAPVFDRSSYEAFIVENNTPGLSIFKVKARDADWKQNARVSYILEDSSINGVPIYRWRQSRILYHSNLPVIPYYPPRYSDTLGTGTLQHVYNYEVCRTTDSRKSDCKFGNAGSQNVLIMDPSSTGTMQRIQSEKSILDEPDSPLENVLIMDPSSTGTMQRIQSEKSILDEPDSPLECCYCCYGRHHASRYHQRPGKDLHLQLNTDGPIRYMEVVGSGQDPNTRTYRPVYPPTGTLSRPSDFVFVKTPMMSHNNTLSMTLSRKHLMNSAGEESVAPANLNTPNSQHACLCAAWPPHVATSCRGPGDDFHHPRCTSQHYISASTPDTRVLSWLLT
ncbi:hypothetical protein CRUP_013774 [Coryphaenoides rupestris]|nr:hypothetical protein CRUP_013774 [Coryphaenoides rupestris]